MKLYAIREDYRRAFDALLDTETGEIQNFEILEAIESAFDEKAEAIACYIKERIAEATALKAEEEALNVRRKQAEKSAESLKGYLSSNMQAMGRDKLATPRCAISFISSKSVEIINQSEIPAQYIKTTITESPDKTAIKAAIKAGTLVAGAVILEKQNIQIK